MTSVTSPQNNNTVSPVDIENKSQLLKKTVQMAAIDTHAKKTAEIKQLFGDILVERKKFPEVLFKSEFLPMFSGEVEHNEDKLKSWYSISGGPFEFVDLTDSDGNIVYTVPPVLDRDVLKMSSGVNGGISTLFQNYNNMLQLSPNSAEAMVARELSVGLVDTNEPEPEKDLVNKWRTLLSHYGKGENTNNHKPVTMSNDDLGIEFE